MNVKCQESVFLFHLLDELELETENIEGGSIIEDEIC